ncbi:MAG: hypothetical protein COT43_02940 [Candidatus Marinimicrobia bacterium CG08_land_8_20_14_0_20_45_22]|nr:MAG: hypothetical protein COT43_02940 [Candidatus Marinimicrobia bacterium CG08_land_8_20_14_0_20_45_22]
MQFVYMSKFLKTPSVLKSSPLLFKKAEEISGLFSEKPNSDLVWLVFYLYRRNLSLSNNSSLMYLFQK